MQSIGVFLIGRRTMCVEGLAAVLSSFEDVDVIGRSFEWADGVARCRPLEPDVVVLDMTDCPECGPCTPVEIIEQLQPAHVVVLLSHAGDPSVVDALEAGALGYVVASAAHASAIHSTITAAARGKAALDPGLSSAVLARMRALSRTAARGGNDLHPTEREAAVLVQLVKGQSNRAIARELNISESTVKNHLHSIYSKLEAESRSQAVSIAIQRGLAAP